MRYAGALALLLTAGAATPAATVEPASAAPGVARAAEPGPGDGEKARSGDRLGRHDRNLLARAQARGAREVTVLVATDPGAAGKISTEMERLGGRVGYRNERLGYVRGRIPTASVEQAAGLGAVLAVDLDESVPLPDPRPDGGASRGRGSGRATPAPGPSTPRENPYLPTNETGATAFTRAHPQWDGRGITIGILDSGVDLNHPALQTTSTGERKIVDWVTATDPLIEGDRTWRPMITSVTGPTFEQAGQTWTAPAGRYAFNRFAEAITAGSEVAGDVNRDGDTTDTWGILYRPSDAAIWVDVDQDNSFTDEVLMRPYREKFQVGHFGTDDPATALRERMPFVVEFRRDVDLSPVGASGTADFVNIGIVGANHGSHVAGIAAGNDLFGGDMDGAAPGARIVSSRACTWSGGCTAVALVEGMIDLVVNRRVDVVNMSIGGLPPLNDGNNARARLYNRLINDYGVQLFLSAGNSGPGVNTVGDPSVASAVVSVGASVSRATWRANYGAEVSAPSQLFPFSSRGPSEDGGRKPDLTAPGAAISAVPTWQPGQPVPESGYELPPGYAMFNGTSMSAPQATGGAALLLSAARATAVPVTPAQLRGALYSSARFLPGVPAHAQGMGGLDVPDAWSLLQRGRLEPRGYVVDAPVCTPISDFLATRDRGVGIYNRCAADAGGHAPGQAQRYDVTVTRTSGPAGDRRHDLSWLGNDGTFTTTGSVDLPLRKPRTIAVTARPTGGVHSAILRLDDPDSPGVDAATMNVVVAGSPLRAPAYRRSESGRVERSRTTSHFVTVPKGASALVVGLSGIATGSQTRWIAINPYGVPVESTSSLVCYTNFSNPQACNPVSRSYADPLPGVWEIEVESRRTTPFLENPYKVSAAVFATVVNPATVRIAEAPANRPVPLSWRVRSTFAPATVSGRGGPLGSAKTARPTIADGATQRYTVEVPAGAGRLEVRIGSPSDLEADLDLTVLRGGVVVGRSAGSHSEEQVTLANPAPGAYTVEVDGFHVPAGSTAYDYRDVFYAGALGTLRVGGAPVELGHGEAMTVSGTVTAETRAAAGRELFGEMTVVTEEGAVIGRGGVVIHAVSG